MSLPKLSPDEWRSLHLVLLNRRCSVNQEGGGAAWRSAKCRVGKRLKEIYRSQFLDFESCNKLKEAFNPDQLQRIGIFHLVERACVTVPSSSADAVPGNHAITGGLTSQHQQQASTSSSSFSNDPSGSHHHQPSLDIDVDEASVPSQQEDEQPESAGGMYKLVFIYNTSIS